MEKPTERQILEALNMIWGYLPAQEAKDFREDCPELFGIAQAAHSIIGHGYSWEDLHKNAELDAKINSHAEATNIGETLRSEGHNTAVVWDEESNSVKEIDLNEPDER